MAELNKLSLKFDEQRFNRDLFTKLIDAVIGVAIKLAVTMEFSTNDNKLKQSFKINYDSRMYEWVDFGLYSIEATVGSTMWRSFIENYGYGSGMNIGANEDIERYIYDKYWNPAREDKTIVGRPKGWYKTLDWDSLNPVKEVWRYSEGKYEGENIENMVVQMPNGGKKKMFVPKEGTLFMQNAFSEAREYFEEEIKKAINSMDLSKYLTTEM